MNTFKDVWKQFKQFIRFDIETLQKVRNNTNIAIQASGGVRSVDDIEKVINHYEPHIQDLDDNVIDFAMEREIRDVW